LKKLYFNIYLAKIEPHFGILYVCLIYNVKSAELFFTANPFIGEKAGVSIAPGPANIPRKLKENLLSAQYAHTKSGKHLVILGIRKARNFSALNRAKRYGETKLILAKSIAAG
jgi:hypothetical protein